MADPKNKANDPQEEVKVDLLETISPPEGDSNENENTFETAVEVVTEVMKSPKREEPKKRKNTSEEVKDFSQLDLTALVEEFEKRTNSQQWFSDGKNIQEVIHTFDAKFKIEIQEKKESFIKEGGNEIDFYFKPKYKNEFDQTIREFKKKKRSYFQEREQIQKLNLNRKLEIIEGLKELINIDENINTIYKKFKNLQDSWHKTGPVPRVQSNNVWQTYKHHTEIFYDFLHLNRELRDLDFKHNYEEKIKIIEQAEALSEIPDVLKASRDLNTLHRLWKNDLGPVAMENREELWIRFQAASQIIHAKRQVFDKEYENILEENLNKKNALLDRMKEIKNKPPKKHNEWLKAIDAFNKMREDFQSIGQVTKKYSTNSWTRFREISREFNQEKNQFYKSQKAEQKKNIDLKKALINEVKEILDHNDWRSYSNRMKNIQKDWRDVGFVPRKLSNALWEEFCSQCNLYFNRIKSGYHKVNKNEVDAHDIKVEFIKRIEDLQIPPELEPFKEFYNYKWEEYNQLGALSGNTNKKSIEDFNKAFFSLIDKSNMEKRVKADAKIHIHFSMIKNDENELNREIQKVKKIIEELNQEERQLENNLDYFSNTSSDNPLLVDVTSRLEKLKSQVEKHNEQLVNLRKIKREIDANNAPLKEETEENPEEGNGTER
ncbi:DUF349 domain-containing protein [Flavobacteriaceae bacterium]|nr:DUF349 domain-containing protein [Flavobacteriaceae bacterium]